MSRINKRLGLLFALHLNAAHLAFGQVALPGIPANPTSSQRERIASKNSLLERTRRLKVSISLDRPTYLLGENIRIQITIQNPTALPLEVLAPFHCATGGINAYWLRDKQWQELLPEPFEFGTLADEPPVALIGGWQQLERSFESSDRLGCNPALVQPHFPGLYRIQYSYGGPQIEFRVLEARLRDLVIVPLARSEVAVDDRTGEALLDPQTGKRVEYRREVRIAVLVAAGTYYLVVTKFGGIVDGSVRLAKDQLLGFTVGSYLYPFVRIAESSEPILSPTASVDDAENLLLRWSTPDGKAYSVFLNAAREVMP
jgi:hypothetical protein